MSTLRIAAGIAVVITAACDRAPAPTPQPTPVVESLRIDQPDPTTSPEIAMLNFHAQVEEIERHLRLEPTSLQWQTAMLQTRQEEVSALGMMSSLDRIVELGDRIVKDHPNEPKAHLARASARSAIHDFDGAAKALDRASELGATAKQLEPHRASLALALGNIDEAHAIYTARIAANPATNDLVMDGLCLAAMGKTEEADASMQRGASLYRDVSPFMIAWIYFERGNLWDRAGKLDRAIAYYRIAIERLPQYAHAALHLANLLPDAQAKPLLEPLSADDPEVHGSAAVYDAWMKKYPLAFADHAGWFYLSVRDPQKAVEAADINLRNRKTPEAYELGLAARRAAKMDACPLAAEAAKLKYPSEALRRAIARLAC